MRFQVEEGVELVIEKKQKKNVHFCTSVFEKSFSKGTSNLLHHAAVILSVATWDIVSKA